MKILSISETLQSFTFITQQSAINSRSYLLSGFYLNLGREREREREKRDERTLPPISKSVIKVAFVSQSTEKNAKLAK